MKREIVIKIFKVFCILFISTFCFKQVFATLPWSYEKLNLEGVYLTSEGDNNSRLLQYSKALKNCTPGVFALKSFGFKELDPKIIKDDYPFHSLGYGSNNSDICRFTMSINQPAGMHLDCYFNKSEADILANYTVQLEKTHYRVADPNTVIFPQDDSEQLRCDQNHNLQCQVAKIIRQSCLIKNFYNKIYTATK